MHQFQYAWFIEQSDKLIQIDVMELYLDLPCVPTRSRKMSSVAKLNAASEPGYLRKADRPLKKQPYKKSQSQTIFINI